MSRKVQIHFGMGKGGSTLIQKVASDNAKSLSDFGWSYDPSFRPLLFETNPSVMYELPDTNNNVFISNENALNPLSGNKFGPYSGGDLFLNRCVRPLQAKGVELGFSFVCRNLMDFHISQFIQRKKQGSPITFDEWASQLSENSFRYNNMLNVLEVVSKIGSVRVHYFDDLSVDPSSFLQDFFTFLPTECLRDLTLSTQRINPSISQLGIEILEQVKGVVSEEHYKKFRFLIQAALPKKDSYEWENELKEKFETVANTNFKNFKRIGEQNGWH